MLSNGGVTGILSLLNEFNWVACFIILFIFYRKTEKDRERERKRKETSKGH